MYVNYKIKKKTIYIYIFICIDPQCYKKCLTKSKCNQRGRTIKKPKKYCTTDSDKPTNKEKAKNKILEEMTIIFRNSEESDDASSQSSDNESNFSTDSENDVEIKKRFEKKMNN